MYRLFFFSTPVIDAGLNEAYANGKIAPLDGQVQKNFMILSLETYQNDVVQNENSAEKRIAEKSL